jgi:hypothetical protein
MQLLARVSHRACPRASQRESQSDCAGFGISDSLCQSGQRAKYVSAIVDMISAVIKTTFLTDGTYQESLPDASTLVPIRLGNEPKSTFRMKLQLNRFDGLFNNR